MSKTIIYDTELLGGKFLFKGRVKENRNVITIWGDDPDAIPRLREVVESGCTFVSYNGIKFDEIIIGAVLAGLPYAKLKRIANALIHDEVRHWEIRKMYGLSKFTWQHIDLMEVAPGFVSLKAYGARMHLPWCKDLPYAHDVESLTAEEFEEVDRYCENDLDTTEALYDALKGGIDLRVKMSTEYGVDLRSKSEAQMAEAVFIQRCSLTKKASKIPYSIGVKAPTYLDFAAPEFVELVKRIESHEFLLNQKTGAVMFPSFLEAPIKLNSGVYQLGIGGIHSKHDKKVCHVSAKDWLIFDIDAASYYANLIINAQLIPKNTGEKFIQEYSDILSRRLKAKAEGNKAVDAPLKLVLTNTFGKLGERWSAIYSPDLMITTTLHGQLTLLNLIEKLEAIGVVALSVNTDGICIGCHSHLYPKVQEVVQAFSERSNLTFEYTPYKTLAMKDVNNYLAVSPGGKVKSRGIYAVVETSTDGAIVYKPNLGKNPTAPVCTKAVAVWLRDGIPFEKTIHETKDIREFISVRGISGGGKQGDEFLGRVARWYQSIDTKIQPITYGPGKKEGHKVAKTEGGRACMILPLALPIDLDYNWYHKEAINIAINLGCREYLTPEEIALVTPPPKIRKPRKTK